MGWRRRLARGALVVTGCAGIAGIAVAIGTVLWPDGGGGQVKLSDLVVAVRPLQAAGTQYVLPVAAPLEDLPAGAAGCPQAARDWLRSMGRERVEGFDVTLRNAGTARAGLLRVTDVRAEGVRALVTEPVVAVRCAAPASTDTGPAATAAPTPPPSDRAVRVDTDAGTAEPPFELGLVPGESDELRVQLDGRLDFRGTFTARVTDGSRVGVVPLDLGGSGDVDRPGLGSPPPLVVEVAGPDGDLRFRCIEGDRQEACSAPGMRARAARLWQRPDVAATALTSALGSYGCADPPRLAGALDQVWRGFYGRDPTREDQAYDALVRRPLQALSRDCGRGIAVAALDASGAGAAGSLADLRSALLEEGADAAPEATAVPATCEEASLRSSADDAGARPLAETAEGGAYFYDGFRAHACSLPYALVEASRSDTGLALFWLLEAADGQWGVRATTAIGGDAGPGRALFRCRDLADDGMDVDAMRGALAPAQSTLGRPVCD